MRFIVFFFFSGFLGGLVGVFFFCLGGGGVLGGVFIKIKSEISDIT
jgi:hypothetical protein